MITSSVVLTNDLNCSGDGLTVRASNVTINLNGHKLVGQGTGVGIRVPATDEGTTGVRIENGSVESFGSGIFFARSDGEITNMVSVRNTYGFLINRSFVPIAASVASWNAANGIDVFGERTVIRDSVADHNGGDGLHQFDFPAAVTGLHAWWNGGLGINVPTGTGLGNWCKHNGDPRQSVGVPCSTTGKPKG